MVRCMLPKLLACIYGGGEGDDIRLSRQADHSVENLKSQLPLTLSLALVPRPAEPRLKDLYPRHGQRLMTSLHTMLLGTTATEDMSSKSLRAVGARRHCMQTSIAWVETRLICDRTCLAANPGHMAKHELVLVHSSLSAQGILLSGGSRPPLEDIPHIKKLHPSCPGVTEHAATASPACRRLEQHRSSSQSAWPKASLNFDEVASCS